MLDLITPQEARSPRKWRCPRIGRVQPYPQKCNQAHRTSGCEVDLSARRLDFRSSARRQHSGGYPRRHQWSASAAAPRAATPESIIGRKSSCWRRQYQVYLYAKGARTRRQSLRARSIRQSRQLTLSGCRMAVPGGLTTLNLGNNLLADAGVAAIAEPLGAGAFHLSRCSSSIAGNQRQDLTRVAKGEAPQLASSSCENLWRTSVRRTCRLSARSPNQTRRCGTVSSTAPGQHRRQCASPLSAAHEASKWVPVSRLPAATRHGDPDVGQCVNTTPSSRRRKSRTWWRARSATSAEHAAVWLDALRRNLWYGNTLSGNVFAENVSQSSSLYI